eukprot:COSAG04_NODE_19931_length_405_cov_0.500000_1_plen_84_part_10
MDRIAGNFSLYYRNRDPQVSGREKQQQIEKASPSYAVRCPRKARVPVTESHIDRPADVVLPPPAGLGAVECERVKRQDCAAVSV